jgi:hypothetical protein
MRVIGALSRTTLVASLCVSAAALNAQGPAVPHILTIHSEDLPAVPYCLCLFLAVIMSTYPCTIASDIPNPAS